MVSICGCGCGDGVRYFRDFITASDVVAAARLGGRRSGSCWGDGSVLASAASSGEGDETRPSDVSAGEVLNMFGCEAPARVSVASLRATPPPLLRFRTTSALVAFLCGGCKSLLLIGSLCTVGSDAEAVVQQSEALLECDASSLGAGSFKCCRRDTWKPSCSRPSTVTSFGVGKSWSLSRQVLLSDWLPPCPE